MYTIKIKNEIPVILLIIGVYIAAFFVYPHLPEQIPVHWNIHGEVDNYINKGLLSLLLFPTIILTMYLLLLFVPYLDKHKERYVQFQKVYTIIKFALVLFMIFIYVITTLYALEYNIKVEKVVPAGVSILFIIIGNYLGKVRKNWFVGIKYPWTLKNDLVWEKTHRLGAVLFVLSGISGLIGVFFNGMVTMIMLFTPLTLTIVITLIYSYRLYKKVTQG
jgi:uncharacterized membrane protein